MDAQVNAEILRHLYEIPDPRRHNRIHKLTDIITIACSLVLVESIVNQRAPSESTMIDLNQFEASSASRLRTSGGASSGAWLYTK